MSMRAISAFFFLAVGITPAQASWLYCKVKPADCTLIQGTLNYGGGDD